MFTLRSFPAAKSQAEALADAVRDALQLVLNARGPDGRATLAVSGGTSPKQFLQILATRQLDWPRIDVTLVDDRWVGETGDGSADSNARLVRTTLLTDAAQAARFIPLVDPLSEPHAHVALLNQAPLPARPDVAVLGMGDDGHSASLFADAPEWDTAITTAERFILVHPGAAPHLRISWTLSEIVSIEHLFLQIGGAAKLEVFTRAAATPQRNAISAIVNHAGVALDVYWFA